MRQKFCKLLQGPLIFAGGSREGFTLLALRLFRRLGIRVRRLVIMILECPPFAHLWYDFSGLRFINIKIRDIQKRRECQRKFVGEVSSLACDRAHTSHLVN